MSMLPILIHELMSEPYNFRQAENDTISNGYYKISLDARRYYMGAASYQPEGADLEILVRAIDHWKKKLGYVKSESGTPVPRETPIYDEPIYQKFASKIKTAHTAFLMHHDDKALVISVAAAVSYLDEEVSRLEAKKKREAGPK